MYHDTDREERSSMIEMTEAEYGVLGEAAEAEYGICDLLDENIPSPLEMDNAGEKLVLPEIQDMTEYIRRHYEQEIMKKLAWRLRWEELCVVSDGKYYQDLPWTGSEDYGEEVSLPDPEDVIPKDFDDPRFADEKTRYAKIFLSEKRDCANWASNRNQSWRNALSVLWRKNKASASSQTETFLLGCMSAALVACPSGNGKKRCRPLLPVLRACVQIFAGAEILQPRLLY